MILHNASTVYSCLCFGDHSQFFKNPHQLVIIHVFASDFVLLYRGEVIDPNIDIIDINMAINLDQILLRRIDTSVLATCSASAWCHQ